jgi:hypothetical protein
MPRVFFALPVKETAEQCNAFLHHPLVCFECLQCSLHCLLKKLQNSVMHSHIILWCVFLSIFLSYFDLNMNSDISVLFLTDESYIFSKTTVSVLVYLAFMNYKQS